MLLLCLHLFFQSPQPEVAGGTTPSASQVARAEKLMETTPSKRIRSRNLFDPRRGLTLSQGGDLAAVEPTWPSLLGTQLGKGHKGALLKWPGGEDSIFLALGETREGLRLESVQRDRITLVNVKAGKSRDLELDPERRNEKGQGSELEQLFKTSTQVPARLGKS